MKTIKKLILLFILILVCLALYARFIEPKLLIANKNEIDTKGKTKCKVVVFSDTHFGELYPEENIDKLVNKINKQNADIVVFSGDFFDNYAKDKDILDLNYLSKQLSNISASKDKIAIIGNRDYGGGSYNTFNEVFENGGFKVLTNQSLIYNDLNLNIYGSDDGLLGKPYIPNPSNTSNYNLLLIHEPDIVDNYNTKNYDYIIAGHSHGGQIGIPFIQDRVLHLGSTKYIKGEYDLLDNSLFVTSGVGVTKIPVRLFVPPEICVFNFN